MSQPSTSIAPNRPARFYGEPMRGLGPGGRPLKAGVFNENEVRAAAGMTMALVAVALAYAWFGKVWVPMQVVSTVLFVEFVLRVALGLHHSPMGMLGRLATRRYRPHWVSARPKRFAWSIAALTWFAMMLITNGGVRGALPLAICLVCLVQMWLESVLGICIGCRLHAWMVRRGWATRDAAFEVCSAGTRPR
jgi:Domain of unknown function (DUF4395)